MTSWSFRLANGPPLRCTVLADGPSDRVLLDVVRWILQDAGIYDFETYFYTFSKLEQRIQHGVRDFPADLFVIHRDAEKEAHANRLAEIDRAVKAAQLKEARARAVPVRMTEAWFLIDEPALREASGNARGRDKLAWPQMKDLESLPDPKATLADLIKTASGFTGRRLHRLDLGSALERLAQLIRDYSPLRRLTAFAAFEAEMKQALMALGRRETI